MLELLIPSAVATGFFTGTSYAKLGKSSWAGWRANAGQIKPAVTGDAQLC